MNNFEQLDKKNILKSLKPCSSHIGLGSLIFSERITGKYNVFRTKGKLISLILARLNRKRISYKSPVPHNTGPISNFFDFNLSFYFELIRQLMAPQGSCDGLKLMSINLLGQSMVHVKEHGLQGVTMTSTDTEIRENPCPSVSSVSHLCHGFTPRSLRTLSLRTKSYASEIIISRARPQKTSIFTSFTSELSTGGRTYRSSKEILSNLRKEEHQSFQRNRIMKYIQIQDVSKKDMPDKNFLYTLLYTPSPAITLNSADPKAMQRIVEPKYFSLNFISAIHPLIEMNPLNKEKYFLNFSPIKFTKSDKNIHIREANIPLYIPAGAMKSTGYENLSKSGEGIKISTFQKNGLNFNNAFHPLISEIRPSNANMKEEDSGAENLFNKSQTRRNINYTLFYKKFNQDSITHKSTELILKKVKQQKIDNIETKEQSLADNAASTKKYKNFIKESFEETPVNEISIAERVYKIIERKISIEKDRRGLF